jgi:transcriptional regulator with XRE-family HTH domain
VLHPQLLRALSTVGFANLRDLADACDVTPQYLSCIRCGIRRLTPNLTERIATALHIAPEMVPSVFLGPRKTSSVARQHV